MNDKVKIFRYVTEGTFDSYSWQLIENKQKFIGQIMTSKSPVRSCEAVSYTHLYMEKGEYLKEGQIPQWEEPEPKETEVYQQLSLFPSIEEQIGDVYKRQLQTVS